MKENVGIYLPWEKDCGSTENTMEKSEIPKPEMADNTIDPLIISYHKKVFHYKKRAIKFYSVYYTTSLIHAFFTLSKYSKNEYLGCT